MRQKGLEPTTPQLSTMVASVERKVVQCILQNPESVMIAMVKLFKGQDKELPDKRLSIEDLLPSDRKKELAKV